MNTQTKKILFAILLSLISFFTMVSFFSIAQSFLISFIVLMVTLWTNEGLSMAIVSLLPLLLFPSANILTTKEVASNYAHPIIYLFFGGFLLAIAVEKTGLHKWISNKMLNLFPSSAQGIIFALIFTSGLLSSILSNTTTTLLLLPIALFLTDNTRLKIRFVLGIAYGASIGGILTPIGTAPNLIFMGLIEEMHLEPVAFFQWIMMVSPLVFIMFIFVGLVLGYGLKNIKVEHSLSEHNLCQKQKKVLFLLIGLMILLFANAPIRPYYNGLGLSDSGILLGAGLLLFMPPFSILEWKADKDKIPFEIMFLFGAGFSIAMAFTHTGMAKELASHLVSLASMPTIIFMIIVATMITFTTEITSNTALISIMLPIIYEVAHTAGLDMRLFMMIATVCASYAFMLPIATPPNAIAMSSGVIKVRTMASFGIIFNFIGIIMIVITAQLFWSNIL